MPLRQLARDIHCRIAHADHDDIFAAQIDRVVRVAIAVDVEMRVVETAGVARHVRIPMVPVAHEQRVIFARLAGRERHRPAAARLPLGLLYLGVEGDQRPQAEVIHIVAEILPQLRMAGEIGPVRRHRIILERQPPFRRVDMQRLVAGRLAVRILVVPIAADIVRHLEAIERNPLVLQPLCGREARASRADDTGALPLRHVLLPGCPLPAAITKVMMTRSAHRINRAAHGRARCGSRTRWR